MLIQNLCRRLPLLVVVIVCASLSPMLGAQEKGGEKSQKASEEATKSPLITKVIQVKHADVNELRDLLSNFIGVRSSSELGVLVANGTPAQIASVEEAVRTLDLPRPESESSLNNIELNGVHNWGSGPGAAQCGASAISRRGCGPTSPSVYVSVLPFA